LLVQAASDITAMPATSVVANRFFLVMVVDRRDMVVLLGCC
jgi:hypothetical protein